MHLVGKTSQSHHKANFESERSGGHDFCYKEHSFASILKGGYPFNSSLIDISVRETRLSPCVYKGTMPLLVADESKKPESNEHDTGMCVFVSPFVGEAEQL